jgi:hypothetical protein
MREVIFGEKCQYKLLENGDFYSRVKCFGRGGHILQDEWIKKDPSFGKCDYTGNGYLSISATFNGKYVHRLHRLVAIFFVEGYEEGLSVNHIDGNRRNNIASNLEWTTHKENMKNLSTRGGANGFKPFCGKVDEFKMLSIITLLNAGIEQKFIANSFGIDKSNISKIKTKAWESSMSFLINEAA